MATGSSALRLGAGSRESLAGRFERLTLAHWPAAALVDPLGIPRREAAYRREEPLEVDAIVEGSWGAWAIEVKTGPFHTGDLRGLLEFTRRHPRFRPLVLTGRGGASTARRAGVDHVTWSSFLLSGPPGPRGVRS